MQVGLIQLCVSDDPKANLPVTCDLIRKAADDGAELVVTPEVTNLISNNRAHQEQTLALEQNDETLSTLRQTACELEVWILIGSLALLTEDADGRFANRSFLIDPLGQIHSRYDKMHMFDVSVTPKETYRESNSYRPGTTLTLAKTPLANIGMTICYDLRFAHVYRDLAQMGAEILCIPSAFSTMTGAAHWETLLRARAIETGCFVLAPAQSGDHELSSRGSRKTYGHSMIIDPWGRVLCDLGQGIGVQVVEIDLEMVADTRQKLPSLTHDRTYRKPDM
jgi:predicted amidohydrolase